MIRRPAIAAALAAAILAGTVGSWMVWLGRSPFGKAASAAEAARPKGERPSQSIQPPTAPARIATARAAAIAGRRLIRRR